MYYIYGQSGPSLLIESTESMIQHVLYILAYVYLYLYQSQDITFTKIEKRRPWPEGRECHTSCVLGLDTKHPQLLISGGKNMYDHPLKFDVWMLDISSLASEKVVWKKAS